VGANTPQCAFPVVAWYTLVRSLLLASSLLLATVAAGSVSAQPSAPSAAAAPTNAASLSPAASAAEQVVNAFMTDLANGQLEAARQLMAPDAVVMANGQVLGNRDGYINGAAKGDAAALAGTQRELLHRSVQAGADTGWVLSEKRVRRDAASAQGPREVLVTETMLLARTTGGWKITHIHWSTRQAG
jgi:ketosteroid isomerase-like protein